ncbi:MAG: NDP-hexose 2,3-dehydratase family protein [Pseudomonadota bacterium]
MSDSLSLDNWLEAARSRSALVARPVSLSECETWAVSDGAIRHDTGGFFAVRNVASIPQQAEIGSPRVMIDQQEIGWLGFCVRRRNDGMWDWLLHAKTEPGSIDGTQIGPTLQATRSNYRRLHGGKPSPYIRIFRDRSSIISDGPHSEQGDRFLWKFNRNLVALAPRETEPEDHRWRWSSAKELRLALGRPFQVNTDARSVFATAPWFLLSGDGPLFTAPVLQRSYSRLRVARHSARRRPPALRMHDRMEWRFEDIGDLAGWEPDGRGISATPSGYGVRFFDVRAADREVSRWCQPLMTQDREKEIVLLMRVRDGAAQFLVRPAHELGHGNRMEFSASAGPGETELDALRDCDPQEIISLRQSDEGGRFFECICRYSVQLLHGEDATPALGRNGRWLFLADLARLAAAPCTTTNELRTLVSLLLSEQFDTKMREI